MGKIFCLMGKSSSGKDTIYSQLLKDRSLGLDHIVTGTTRPIRAGEQNGREYYFYSTQEMDALKAAGKIIECRGYRTVHGMWYYFTVADDRIDLDSQNYLVITTLEAYQKMAAYYGKDALIPIYLEVDDGLRLQRALDREREQKEPKYAELCRRFLADEEDFSTEKLREAGICRIFQNTNLDQTVDEIKAYIRGIG